MRSLPCGTVHANRLDRYLVQSMERYFTHRSICASHFVLFTLHSTNSCIHLLLCIYDLNEVLTLSAVYRCAFWLAVMFSSQTLYRLLGSTNICSTMMNTFWSGPHHDSRRCCSAFFFKISKIVVQLVQGFQSTRKDIRRSFLRPVLGSNTSTSHQKSEVFHVFGQFYSRRNVMISMVYETSQYFLYLLPIVISAQFKYTFLWMFYLLVADITTCP